MKLSERLKDWYGYNEGFTPSEVDAEFDVIVDEVAQLEADIGECSVCGQSPALLVDREHKGTYWLCGDCMGERIIDKIELEAKIEDIERMYGDLQDAYRDALKAGDE